MVAVAGLDADGDTPSGLTESPSGGVGLRPRVYDRIVRITSFVFIAAVMIAIEVGRLWPDTSSAIFVVLGSMILFLLFVQDILPPTLLGKRRFVLEGVAGVAFVTTLVVLTGGSSSPFFFLYFLIVAGAALWLTGTASILLAALTALAYLVGLAFAPMALGSPAASLSAVGFNLLALALMAYLARVAGHEQRRISDRALKLSRYDALTQLYYRAYFLELMDREIQRAVRTGRGFCLLMLDLDDLKPINDTFGHPFGDRMLRAVGDVIRREVRASDVAARYGGDEFIVLLPETEPPGAIVLAEKLRADIAHIGIRLPDRSLGTSVSIGLASFPADGTTIEHLIRTVDQAMYEAKRLGKNRIAYRDHGDTAGDGSTSGAGQAPVPVMGDAAGGSVGGGDHGGGAGSASGSPATERSTPAGGVAKPAAKPPATAVGTRVPTTPDVGASAPSRAPGPTATGAGATPGAPGPAGTGPETQGSTSPEASVPAGPELTKTSSGMTVRGPVGAAAVAAVAAGRALFSQRPQNVPATSSAYDATEDPFGPWLRGAAPRSGTPARRSGPRAAVVAPGMETVESPRAAVPVFGPAGSPGEPMPHTPRRLGTRRRGRLGSDRAISRAAHPPHRVGRSARSADIRCAAARSADTRCVAASTRAPGSQAPGRREPRRHRARAGTHRGRRPARTGPRGGHQGDCRSTGHGAQRRGPDLRPSLRRPRPQHRSRNPAPDGRAATAV